MAPKKNIDGKKPEPPKKVQEKKPKRLIKPKIKIKIKPNPKAGTTSNFTPLSPKSARIPKPSMKKQALEGMDINLTNEVAARQFGYKPPKSEPIEEIKVPKKRGRKKKIPPVPVVATTDSEADFDASPLQKKLKITKTETLKVPKKKPEPVKTVLAKKQGPPKRNLKLIRKKPVDDETKISKTIALKKPKATKVLGAQPKTRKRKLSAITDKLSIGDVPSMNIDPSPPILTQGESATVTNYSNGLNVAPRPIDSRKTSNNSDFSWTKDISSSTTTTCYTVCSSDFVRIDKKLPILKLNDIAYKLAADNMSSSSSSSDSESEDNRDVESDPDLDSKSLDLSTSSVTLTKSPTSLHSRQNVMCIINERATSRENVVQPIVVNEKKKTLDSFVEDLKLNVDMELTNWIGYESERTDIDVNRFLVKVQHALKIENEIIMCCKRLKRVLSNKNDDIEENIDLTDKDNMDMDINDQVDFNNPADERNDFDSLNDDHGELDYNTSIIQGADECERGFRYDRVRHKSIDQNDDDDALSLFAESLTGMETSLNSANPVQTPDDLDFEEYVPQMLSDAREPPEKITYTPSTIPSDDKPTPDVAKAKIVCEKQNADSTSIYKDNYQEKDIDFSADVDFSTPNPPVRLPQTPYPKYRMPKLMSSSIKPGFRHKSIFMRGYCFYHMQAGCKKKVCIYPHIIPTDDQITAKLKWLSEEMFIKEYMLLRDWPDLRRKYGMCFVKECIRRDLTRILVEMGRDFIMKANHSIREDGILKVEVLECVLMHLNSVELGSCEDLLMCFTHNGVPLCDCLMQAIASTQNFSRFKPIFSKLTFFMLNNNRTFDFQVATQILERLAVLPCERPLLEAVLEIVKHTDRRILENSMMGHFEKQLSVYGELLEKLEGIRNAVSEDRPVISNVYETPPMPPTLQPPPPLATADREKRYTSPDTTNRDNMLNKPAEDQIAMQTKEFHRTSLFAGNIQRTITNSICTTAPSISGAEDFRPSVATESRFTNWRRPIGCSLRGRPSPRPPAPPPLMGRIVQKPPHFGRSPPAFPRRSGPEYY